MIVDTSALMALLLGEPGDVQIADALYHGGGYLPAPALVEFHRVAAGERHRLEEEAKAQIERLKRTGLEVVAFTHLHAQEASDANRRYGKGNGQGGTLNLLDLMIYAVAKVEGEPLLCTGHDFAATDVDIHPASRVD